MFKLVIQTNKKKLVIQTNKKKSVNLNIFSYYSLFKIPPFYVIYENSNPNIHQW